MNSHVQLPARGIPLVRVLAFVAAVAGSLLLPASGFAQQAGSIVVAPVEGALDPMAAGLVVRAIRQAEAARASLLVLQIDSPGALDAPVGEVARSVAGAKIPVVVWVGPARATSRGAASLLLAVASVGAAAPTARIGAALPLSLGEERNRGGRLPEDLRRLARRPILVPAGDGTAPILPGRQAVARGNADLLAASLGELIVAVDGRSVRVGGGEEALLSTARSVDTPEGVRRVPKEVRFIGHGLVDELLRVMVSPRIAYLLLLTGLALVVLEFFASGAGLAAGTGALCLAGTAYGFSHLPVSPVGAALMAFSVFGFSVDVQTGALGFWTALGVIASLAGALLLYDGSPLLDLPLWLVTVGTVGLSFFMLTGMTGLVRSRFTLPRFGRDAMIGEAGESLTGLDPEGVVLVRGAPWRARTNRSTPIPPRSPVTVVAVDQLVLEVEPRTPAEPDA